MSAITPPRASAPAPPDEGPAPPHDPEDDRHADDADDAPPRARSVRELLALGAGQVDLLVFRLGHERFAIEIAAVEEAVELDGMRAVPDAATTLLGVTDLRGRLLPVFTPARTLRAPLAGAAPVILVMREGDRRVALAVDDVEDVLVLEPHALRDPSLPDAGDDLVFGVVRVEGDLVTVLDAAALVASCIAPSLEAA